MKDLVQNFYKGLSSYLTEHKAISGEELLWKIGQEVDRLNDDEKKKLEELLGGDLEQTIFDGITGEIKISVFSPDMHVKMNYLGEEFYCPPTHKYMPDELEKAFKRLVNLRFQNNLLLIEDTLRDFMGKAGYEISNLQSQLTGSCKSINALKDGHVLQIYIFPSIVVVPESLESLKEISVEHVLVVPTEKTPAPFINFVRDNRDAIIGNTNIMIWVINIDRKIVSPVVGKPSDKEIWKNFTEPEKSLQATQNWIQGAIRSWRLDEDF